MDKAPGLAVSSLGARFFDGKCHDLGWAAAVARRNPTLGGLTVLDVTTAETLLTANLLSLDKGRLVVRCDGLTGDSYRFAWASGYANGKGIRVQGVLERA